MLNIIRRVQDAYTIHLHWAHSRVVTAVEPSEFVSGSTLQLTSVTVGDAGTEDLVFDANAGSFVVLGVSDSPTCSPMLGSAVGWGVWGGGCSCSSPLLSRCVTPVVSSPRCPCLCLA